MTFATFTFVRNFSDEKKSRFFITDRNGFREVPAAEVLAHSGLLICHDFWMIARDLYLLCGNIPKSIVDLDDLNIIASRDPDVRRRREKFDIVDRMSNFFSRGENVLRPYKKMLYQEVEVEASVQKDFHELLLEYYIELCRRAILNGERDRFFDVEVPCANLCAEISSKGLRINSERVSNNRQLIAHDYYQSIVKISDEFDIPLEVPSEGDHARYAQRLNVDLEEYSLDFAMSYLPQMKAYSDLVKRVRDLSLARDVLNGMPLRSGRVFPIVDTQGSRTSRIAVRSPFLQSLPRRYRDVICPDQGKSLCYVDFDQFEVGIMAALSNDPILHALFAEEDMYESFRIAKLGGQGARSGAKILFLAYAYGMKKHDLPIIGTKFGFERAVVRDAFRSFGVYEKWKNSRIEEFEEVGYVSTSLGNRFYYQGSKPTRKEKLSAVSQIVQGEGSLIFKKTLLKVDENDDVEMLLPMHDALLFQHSDPATPELVVNAFKETMTQHFGGAVQGKASIESFSGEK
ncbi:MULTISPECIES: DNA polymerase [Sphingomonas]|uniref:DNA-directed DNA polymerase n=1 Tax=Sphingomonas paucimobilis NBRC 13935 TaxID=1219050 RepID=A0A0C9M579_SPHPI|nr:DNA polymerase [Sphingomonas paucimobilis]MDG5973584.1 DNA polymerase [Sphingomonas paucimobilis]QPS17895.1 hypothetical protein I6G65_10195 [Sphingomonas paucimobilis]GAN15305.1 hypothetical protein SP6_55_00230 [Sphingomonas paucimobilis NBRC 13935]